MTVIEILEDMLAERRFGDPEKSYVAKLHHKGLDHILKKVGEESTEVVMAAKDAARSKNNGDVIHEVPTLVPHSSIVVTPRGTSKRCVSGARETSWRRWAARKSKSSI